MTLSSPLRKVASKVINKFGGDITFRSIAPSAYSTSTGAAAETATDADIKGVLEDVNKREVNDLIQAGDKRLIIAALDIDGTVPTITDKVVINSRVHQIIRVTTIEQDNEPITYELILRD